MAIHAHSTPMPAPQRSLLRAFAGSPTHPKSGDTPAPTGAVPAHDTHPAPVEGLPPLPTPLPSLSAALSRRRAIFGPVDLELDAMLADKAQAFFRFKALVGAAGHGAALLDALDLPPLALDVLDVAIAALDFRDGDPDLEDGDDAEHDTSDAELDLGWSALHSQVALGPNTADGDATALESFGRGFVRCGADDAEDDDPAERDEEHGSEDEAHPWRCDPSLVALAVQVAHG